MVTKNHHQEEEIMKILRIDRLDHLGLISSVIKEINIIEMIDSRLGTHEQNQITSGLQR